MKNYLVVLLFYSVAKVVTANAEISFKGLGDLPGGYFGSVAADISGDGTTIVGYSSVDFFEPFVAPFRWTEDTGMERIKGIEDQDFGHAMGVSRDGEFAVGWTRSPTYPFRAKRGEKMERIAGERAHANGISNDARTIVGYTSPLGGPVEAFRWTEEEGVVGLGYLPGGSRESTAWGVSADGSVIVGYSRSADYPRYGEAFRWIDGEMRGLGALEGGDYSWAHRVSADGTVVVGYSSSSAGPYNAVFWDADGTIEEIVPGEAYDVSADGSVIVGFDYDRGAFVWDREHGVRLIETILTDNGIDIDGWYFSRESYATGISDNGEWITGYALSDQGWQAYLVQLPEPSSGLILLTVAAATAGVLRHRTRQTKQHPRE
jgi:probable HAF family extracellular repeat protein